MFLIVKNKKSRIKTLLFILFFPVLLVGQKENIRWKYQYTPLPNSHTGRIKYEFTFYENGQFSFDTFSWGIVGTGTYALKDSVLICTYNGERTKSISSDGWVEVRYPKDIKKSRTIHIRDAQSKEVLIGAEVLLLNRNEKILDTLYTGFEGQCTVPQLHFAKIKIKYPGYKSEEVFVFGKLKNDLDLYLSPGHQDYIIAKGTIHRFKVNKIQDQQITWQPIDFEYNVYVKD